MILYMAVTPDKYELPMLIAETKADLARMAGAHIATVCNAINGRKRKSESRKLRRDVKYRFVTVEVEEVLGDECDAGEAQAAQGC